MRLRSHIRIPDGTEEVRTVDSTASSAHQKEKLMMAREAVTIAELPPDAD
jgi:hypothetical protein